MQSSRNSTPRASNFNHSDFGRMSNFGSFGFDEESERGNAGVGVKSANGVVDGGGGKDLHMFVWSSSASPVSDEFRGGENGNDLTTVANAKDYDEFAHNEFSIQNELVHNEMDQEGPGLSKPDYSSMVELHPKSMANVENPATAMPPASVITRLILIMVWRELIRNPNTYSSLFGLTWSLVSYKWGIEMAAVIAKSMSILSDAGLGMAMFSLGLFVAYSLESLRVGTQLRPLPYRGSHNEN